MGALSSIPLCSRGRDGEGELETGSNRPEKMEHKQETIVTQPEMVNHEGIENENANVKTALEEVAATEAVGTKSDEVPEEVTDINASKSQEIISSQIKDDDGNEEVCLDDEPEEEAEISELNELEKPIDHQVKGLASEEDSYRKTPTTMLDTTTAITNMLSEIVMESDSREVVGR